MKEKDIESRSNRHANALGIMTPKFTSPNRAAVPDRIYLAPVPQWLRTYLAGYIRFVEFKAPGQKPTPAQEREHARLRALGFTVEVIDNVEDGKRVAGEMG